MSAFASVIAREEWERWPSSVQRTTDTLLDAMAGAGARATFFTLGWIAERHPQLIRNIVDNGHELACHGYEHTRLTAQDRKSVRQDLRRSKGILEDVSGREVAGFRAASFSIDRTNLWAFEEIAAAGFTYSSSVYPVRHDHYGIPDAPVDPFRPDNAPTLLEIPVATATLLGRRLPAGGGGYFRLFPYWISRALVTRVNENEHRRANMYFHPWEFDPDQPRPGGLTLRTRFRHYVNQSRALPRFRRLLRDFRWGTFGEVYGEMIEGDGS